ncbi:hypothetical protein Taro_004485 [Colocasia esculenta]|uniref:RNase H type-1 domain-containing protein n=1 Tax=Colocasia esculenta TaxID=4460 RepID=A0A843TPL7_COLES|nr:hypothetical protein [Colocasia esculenta]
MNVKSPILVKWLPPSTYCSLNVDGVSKGNPGKCGGGGCIRDSRGNFICGFSFFYGTGNSIVAEARALHDGLKLALDRNIRISVLFSDSATLIRAIAAGRYPHWAVYPWWRGICGMLTILKPDLMHTFREVGSDFNSGVGFMVLGSEWEKESKFRQTFQESKFR